MKRVRSGDDSIHDAAFGVQEEMELVGIDGYTSIPLAQESASDDIPLVWPVRMFLITASPDQVELGQDNLSLYCRYLSTSLSGQASVKVMLNLPPRCSSVKIRMGRGPRACDVLDLKPRNLYVELDGVAAAENDVEAKFSKDGLVFSFKSPRSSLSFSLDISHCYISRQGYLFFRTYVFLTKKKSFLDIPQGFTDVSALRVDSKIQYEEKECVFLGHDIDGNVVMKDAKEVLVRSWNHLQMVVAQERADPNIEGRVLSEEAMFKLTKLMFSRTIRGIPLAVLMDHLRFETGRDRPVFVVGEAVVELMRNFKSDPCEINLVVCCDYSELLKILNDFFLKKGKPLDDATLLKCKAQGMVKIVKSKLDDYDLRIRLLRTGFAPAASSCKYIFGNSILHDAMFRDFAFSAVYVDPLTQKSYAPCGLANSSLSYVAVAPRCIEGKTLEIAFPQREFDSGYGRWFRFWNEYSRMNDGSLKTNAFQPAKKQIEQALLTKIDEWLLQRGGHWSESDIADCLRFVKKFARTLLSNKNDVEMVMFCSSIRHDWLYRMKDLLDSALKKEIPIFNELPLHVSENQQILSICNQFRNVIPKK